MSHAEQVAGWVYGVLSIEPSTALIDAVIQGHEALSWHENIMPEKMKPVLVQVSCDTWIGYWNGNRWLADAGEEINVAVLAWREIPRRIA